MKQDFLEIFQKIAPDLMGTVKERYLLLRHISDAEPVGRRTLAGISGLSERVVRAHVIIGHSERREYFNETDETVNLKVKAALSHKLTPIVCCGESLEQLERGEMKAWQRAVYCR